MMRFMITIKHWLLFLLMVGPALVTSIIATPYELSQSEILANIIGLTVYFLWIWSINKHVSNAFQAGKDAIFKTCFAFVFIYFLSYNLYLLIQGFPGEGYHWLFDVLVLSLTVYCLVVTSRRLKSHELGRSAILAEYIWYFVLLLVFPIGIWILQPKVNRLVTRSVAQ